MREWVVGFDCGGTSTRAIVAAADGRVMGQGVAGPSNYLAVGVEAASAAVRAAFERARAEAKIGDAPCRAAAVAMAGAAASVDLALVAALRVIVPATRFVIDGDIMAAFMAAFPAGTGIVVIAGTGSVVFGVLPSGERVQVGGWGYILGDEGSAYSVGLAALRAAVREFDGRNQPTSLTTGLLAYLGVSSPAGLVRRVYVQQMTRDEIAALVPVVVAHAEAGDAVARAILSRAGGALGTLVATAVERFREVGATAQVAMQGGLFTHVPFVAEQFRQFLRDQYHENLVVAAPFDARGGAVLLALREAGIAPDQRVCANLARTL